MPRRKTAISNEYLTSFLPKDPATRSPVPEDEYNALRPQHPFINRIREADDPSSMMSTSVSAPEPISTSPAAMFLSLFSTPPAPSVSQDAEGDVIEGYTLGGVIGLGATSIIRRAYSATGGVVAIKIIRHADLLKRDDAALARKRIQHEASIWSTLSHEHILPLFSSLHTNHADYFFTLLCPVGTLFDILKRDGRPALPQDDAGMMFRQVVRGLRYLHEVALYVHRDIKLENVLVDEMGTCRIGDFGMSRKIGQLDEMDEDEISTDGTPEFPQTGHATVHRAVSLVVSGTKRPPGGLHSQLARHHHDGVRHRNSTSSAHPARPSQVFQPGSLPYASPELLLPQLSGPLLPHPAQDIWALGVLLYGLLTGRLPFFDPFEPRLQMKILNGAYEVPPDIGRGAERVLQGCLDPTVATRWTIARVDEVAWGVGWGTECDDTTASDFDEEAYQPETPNKNPSSRVHSCSRPPDISIPNSYDWQNEEPRSRPSAEAASRRSSSRFRRSLSRAPVLNSRSSSGRSPRSSRPTSPAPLTLDLHSDCFVGSSSYSRISNFHDTALVTSPSTTLERGRGRRGRKAYPSRSPSASDAPNTPSDRSPAARQALTAKSNGIKHSSPGEHRTKGGHVRTPHLEHQFYFSGDMDVLEETADWVADEEGKDVIQSAAKLNFARLESASPRRPSKRPGSLPPSSTLIWSRAHSAKGTGLFVTPVHTPTLVAPTTKATPRLESFTSRFKRSKSLEQQRPQRRYVLV